MDAEGISMDVFKDAFEKGNRFASGLMVNYGPSNLVMKPIDTSQQGEESQSDGSARTGISPDLFEKRQALAKGLPIGMRFDSFKVLNQSDARPWHFQEKLKSNGRFRVVLFAGNILSASQRQRVEKFCEALDAPNSFLRTVTPAGLSLDTVIEVLTIHSSKRTETELLRDFPEILHPYDPHTGWDYDKVFVDDVSYHEGFGDAYNKYGVDKERGCVVVARPDQHVGWIGELEDFDDLSSYFDGCLVLGPRI